MEGKPSIRICQLITELRPGGAERCVYELSHRLDRPRFEVHAAALRGGAVEGWLSKAGVPTTVLNIRTRFDLPALGRLIAFLRNGKFDILHTHLFHADFVGRLAAWCANVPHLVHTVHTVEGRFRPWQFAFARFFEKRCERIVCVSPSARDFHAARSRLPADRYVVISNGVDVTAFRRDGTARLRLRSLWGMDESDVVVAYVGRLDYEKGTDLLLSAVKLIVAGGGNVRVVIAGDGPQRRLVEEFISRNVTKDAGGGMVRYLGFVDDVPELLSAADMLVMPSRWEGFGLSAAEAMAASLPVIAFNIPGLCDVVVDGETGLLVERENPAALAETIKKLAADADLLRPPGPLRPCPRD